jgi:predicted RNA-binding protein with PUA domain
MTKKRLFVVNVFITVSRNCVLVVLGRRCENGTNTGAGVRNR